MLNKQIELSHLIYHCLGSQKIDVIILVETWHTTNSYNRIKLPGYELHGKENGKGGGVGFFINDQLSFKVRLDLEIPSETVEHSVIELKLKHKAVIINGIYRPPNTNQDSFIMWFDKLHEKLMKHNCKDFVMGMDHNMDLLKQ